MALRFRGVWLLLVFAFILSGPTASLTADPAARKVLILHSYNERFSWVRAINQGLGAGLTGAAWDLWYEDLDAKNLPLDFDLSTYDQLMARKYTGRQFDLIITVDDTAYQYFLRTRQTIFGGARALALGMNAAPEVRQPGISYLIENPDFVQTIDRALVQQPRAETVHIVLDRSITGQLVRRQIEAATYRRSVRFDWIDAGTGAQIEARTAAVPPGDVLIFGVFFDPSEGYQSNDRILARIRATARVPVYGFWDFSLDQGAFGGFLYSGQALGTQGAGMARDLLLGGAPALYRDETLSAWTFDWTQAQAAGLGPEVFPEGTRWIHRPDDFWQINQGAAVAFGVVFLVLAGFTVLIFFNLRAQRTLVAYGESVIATQRELMHNLGNVIENRSDETASHVQRITVLGLFLADLAGLGKELRDQLEVCAPMHDIGKVGIPDSILKKPGILTPEEYEVMKTHTTLGYSIFRSSPNPMIQAAARIALEHHEHWNGRGYPQGKAGEEIDLLARIVSIVDVCDALLAERTYKEAWAPARVRQFLNEGSGSMFDPQLVAEVDRTWDEFYGLWEGARGEG